MDAGDTAYDYFNYTVSDGTDTDIGVIRISILGINDAPVAQNDEGVIVEAGTLTVANRQTLMYRVLMMLQENILVILFILVLVLTKILMRTQTLVYLLLPFKWEEKIPLFALHSLPPLTIAYICWVVAWAFMILNLTLMVQRCSLPLTLEIR